MRKLITTTADFDTARQYVISGYCHSEINPDNATYTIWAESTDHAEVKPFGYRLRDDDDWNGIYNAWVSPQGTVYYVFYWGHAPFAYSRHRTTCYDLERMGWIHWSFGSIANTSTRMTRAQRDSVVYLMIGIGDNSGAEKLLKED